MEHNYFKRFFFCFFLSCFLDIIRRQIGERVLPIDYVKIYFNKKPNLTWEQMYLTANAEYSQKQQKQLQKIAKKECLEKEAREKECLEKEKEQHILLEKQQAEERERKLEEERQHEKKR